MSFNDQQLETIEAVESLEWNSDTAYEQHRDMHHDRYQGYTEWLDRDFDLMREEMEDELQES